MNKLLISGTIFAAAMAMAPASYAAEMAKAPAAPPDTFYATPMQSGAPRELPGEKLIPGAELAADTINAVTQPVLQPLLAPDGATAAGAAPTKNGHHHKHHAM